MESEQLMREIMNDTYTILRALEAKDVDIFEAVIEKREVKINMLLNLELDKNDAAVKAFLDVFQKENEACKLNSKLLFDELEIEHYKNRAEIRNLSQKKRVHSQYFNPLDTNLGSSIDNKK